jgi:hypothetical protein
VVRKDEDGKEDEIGGFNRRTYTHWQLDDNYRMDIEMFPDNSTISNHRVSLSWDAGEGVMKNTFQSNEIEGRIFGRVDTRIERIVESNDYVFWLQGGAFDTKIRPYLFPLILENKAKWDIVCLAEDKMIQGHL